MKEFAHPGNGHKQYHDLNRAIQSTLTVSRNEWKYVADVVTDFAPDLPPVPCLAGDFNQVILNLVVNAAQAIAEVVGDGANGKGTIIVRTRLDGDWAEIRVEDTGSGIPENIREQGLRSVLHYQGRRPGDRPGTLHRPRHRRAEARRQHRFPDGRRQRYRVYDPPAGRRARGSGRVGPAETIIGGRPMTTRVKRKTDWQSVLPVSSVRRIGNPSYLSLEVAL